MTSVTEVRSASACLFAGTWRPLVSVITTLLLRYVGEYFSSSSVVLRDFSALCVYSKFGHHPHPLSYLCAKFRFFCGLHCCANPRRKIAYSFTHPAYLMPGEPKCLHFGKLKNPELQFFTKNTGLNAIRVERFSYK